MPDEYPNFREMFTCPSCGDFTVDAFQRITEIAPEARCDFVCTSCQNFWHYPYRVFLYQTWQVKNALHCATCGPPSEEDSPANLRTLITEEDNELFKTCHGCNVELPLVTEDLIKIHPEVLAVDGGLGRTFL